MRIEASNVVRDCAFFRVALAISNLQAALFRPN
jgi:hypothetical protein